MTDKEKAAMLRNAIASRKGDDLERAQAAFRGATPEQMQEQYGQSGRTRQQILDEYLDDRAKVIVAARFLDELLQARGL